MVLQQIQTVAQNSYSRAKDVLGRVIKLPIFSLILLVVFVVILLWVMVRMYKMSQSAIKQNIQIKTEQTERTDSVPAPASGAAASGGFIRKRPAAAADTYAAVDQAMEPVAPLVPSRPAAARPAGAGAGADEDEWGRKRNGGCKVCNYFYTK